MSHTPDFLVVGAGIVGLTVARALAREHPDASVMVIDKEPALAEHASGRNSGVLHAGFYYTADSLKARFTRDGNRQLTAWCEARGVPVRRCGKLVVARDATEHAGLDELLARGKRNGVELVEITEAEAREIEPRVLTSERALWSPTTSSVDPSEVVRALAEEIRDAGVVVRTSTPYLGRAEGLRVRVPGGEIEPGYLINCAGLYADRVARDFGFSKHYAILPFKGLYLYGDDDQALRTNIYPVPDLGMPFLGVHFTVTVDGHVKIGPTALPAFWRENYGGLHRFSLVEMVQVLSAEARMFLTDATFRRLAREEIDKSFRTRLARRAAGLATGVEPSSYRRWGRPGIRAQLLDRRTGSLVMDFLVEGDDRSLHVLNAVSPAFTCALPFADHVVGRVAELCS